MPAPDDWWRLDATAQAALVRSGETTPEELVELALARIERLNPTINAVITPLPDEARRLVAKLPDDDLPFRGVPILLKDAGEELEGTPYYLGTSVLRDIDYRSKRTTELVRRLLAAGFIPVGKTNVPEFSYGFATKPLAFGPTRNPWDLTRTAGGSSGGSAAAVAAGLVSIAQGSDGNGSIRVPAACCGLATLRPSRGLVPAAIPRDLPDPGPTWTAFVLARSIRDLSGTLDAVANPQPAEDLPTTRLRIGTLWHEPEWPGGVHSDVAAAVERVGALLSAAGHIVSQSYPAALDHLWRGTSDEPLPLEAAAPVDVALSVAGVRWLEEAIGRPVEDGDVLPIHLRGRSLTAPSQAEFDAAVTIVQHHFEQTIEWWDTHDVLVMPIQRQPAWPLGDGDDHDWLPVGMSPMQFVHIGYPCLALPIAMTDDGLPLGVQFVGRIGSDRQLLALAAQLEAAAPWADRWPPLASQ